MGQNVAVFLDRDGVLNLPVFNPQTQEYESPHSVADLKIYPGVFSALQELQKHFRLFVVSNQPSFAKGKVSLQTLKDIAEQFRGKMEKAQIHIAEYYYCFHHPNGIIPEYTVRCDCRKPGTRFLMDASEKFGLDLKGSWMVGDRDTDILCGKKAGCQTILIQNPLSRDKQGNEKPMIGVTNITEAAKYILAQ